MIAPTFYLTVSLPVLVKIALLWGPGLQYFYIEKTNHLFTFTLPYGTMYVVKIGNYPNISG